MTRGKLCAVIGGQYGSEGKGTIVKFRAHRYEVHVRVGSHNAGHSFKHAGRIWKMQQIPVGWTNPRAAIIIGRGALISPETLDREINAIAMVDPTIKHRLLIDAMAGVLDESHHKAEGGVEGGIHERIGSTGEGVGAARIARLERDPRKFYHFKDLVRQPQWGHLVRYLAVDTSHIIRQYLTGGMNVLLEGSQGVHLSITHGPWPYVTTTDCGAAQLCADVGVPPTWLTDVLCVLRTYPIRVAGNSGPMENEITWEGLSSLLGKDVQERTTVTKKIRRIAVWDDELVRKTVELNAPTAFALNFLDYLHPRNEGVTRFRDLVVPTQQWIEALEERYGVPVRYCGTGGPDWTVFER